MKKDTKKQDVSKIMPRSHLLSIVIVIAMLIYKDFFEIRKMNKMLLRIYFITLVMYPLFSKVILCNTEVKN